MSDNDQITTYDDANDETNLVIKDVTECLKKIKSKKDIEESEFNEFKTESNELKEEIDLLIQDVEGIKKENNSQVKFFDTKKKSLISKLQDSKKQLDDQKIRTEKQIQKKAERDRKIAEKNKLKEEKIKEKEKKESDKKEDTKKKDEKKKTDEQGDTKSTKSVEDDIPDDAIYSDDDFEDEDDKETTSKEIENDKVPKPQPRKNKPKLDKDDKDNKESEETQKKDKHKNILKRSKLNKSIKEDELEDIKEEIIESENEDKDKKEDDKSEKDNNIDEENKKNKSKSTNKERKDSKKKVKNEDKDDNEDEEEKDEDDKDKKKKSIGKDDKEKDSKKEDKKKGKDNEEKTEEKNKKKESSIKDRLRGSLKKSKKLDDENENKKKGKDEEKDKEKDQRKFTEKVEEEIKAEKEQTVQAALATKQNVVQDDDIFPPSQKLLITETVKPVEDDDLECKPGEIVEFIESCEDEEFIYVKNSENKEGYIPLKSVKVYEKQEIQEPVKERVKERSTHSKKPKKDPKAKLESTLNEDDMRTDTSYEEKKPKNLSDMFQGSIKKREISDVLQYCGDLPSGFRFSTVEKWIQRDYNRSLNAKLSKSALSFSDLFMNPDRSMIRPRPTRIQRCFQVVKGFQMPRISEEFQVQSHHVKVCLFDKEKPTSNVYILKAVVNEKDKKTWLFNNKMVESSKSTDYNELFIRSDKQSPDLCILLEFCVLGKKTGGDDTQFEFSCGWCTIPLYEESGQVINSKSGDFQLNGGTPFEDGVDIDPDVMASATTRRMFASNPAPQVMIKIFQPNKENKDFIETLPDNMVGSMLHLPLFSYYRNILAVNVLNRRQDLTSAEPIYSPFLVAFLEACQTRDILDITRIVWWEKFKLNRNLNKKDPTAVNGYFQEVFMDHIYPLTKLTNLPPYDLLNPGRERERWTKIMDFIQKSKQNKLGPLLSGEFCFSPVIHTELSFKVINSNAKFIE